MTSFDSSSKETSYPHYSDRLMFVCCRQKCYQVAHFIVFYLVGKECSGPFPYTNAEPIPNPDKTLVNVV